MIILWLALITILLVLNVLATVNHVRWHYERDVHDGRDPNGDKL